MIYVLIIIAFIVFVILGIRLYLLNNNSYSKSLTQLNNDIYNNECKMMQEFSNKIMYVDYKCERIKEEYERASLFYDNVLRLRHYNPIDITCITDDEIDKYKNDYHLYKLWACAFQSQILTIKDFTYSKIYKAIKTGMKYIDIPYIKYSSARMIEVWDVNTILPTSEEMEINFRNEYSYINFDKIREIV